MLAYNVFGSQVIRASRICTNGSDFALTARSIIGILLSRGYSKLRLKNCFNKICDRYPEILYKYGASVIHKVF